MSGQGQITVQRSNHCFIV